MTAGRRIREPHGLEAPEHKLLNEAEDSDTGRTNLFVVSLINFKCILEYSLLPNQFNLKERRPDTPLSLCDVRHTILQSWPFIC